jgi:hypothetical protein
VFGMKLTHHVYKSIMESDDNYQLLTIAERRELKKRKKDIDFS